MKKVNNENGKGKGEDALKWALDKFEKSWEYATQNMHARWEENWKLFHNQRTRRKHGGIAHTFVPMVNSSVNTIVAALYNSTPRFNFVPDTPEQEQDVEVLSEIIDDFSLKDGWAEKNRENGTNMIITGSGPVYYQWQNDRITKEVIPVRDFICDPTATSWRNWSFAGRRYFTSLSSLKECTVLDPDTGETKPRYSIPKDMRNIDGGSTGYMSDKEIKDTALGQSSLGMEGKVEIIEIWTKKRVVTVANRSTVIEDVKNPYLTQERTLYEAKKLDWELQRQMGVATGMGDIGEYPEPFVGEGLIPFALGRNYIDSSLIYGTSDVDIIKEQQELLNDLKEMNLEAIFYQLYPEKTIDPKYAAWADDLDPKPGKVYPFPAGAMQWNNPPAVPANAFNEISVTKAEMREAVAVDSIVKGVTSATSQTATEIKAQMGQASQRIEMKAKTLEDDFFLQEASICLKLIRLYMRDATKVRVIKNTGAEWVDYDPSAFFGEYTPMVKLDITRELEKSKDQQEAVEAYKIIKSDGTNNMQAAAEIMYPKMISGLSHDELMRIITPPAPTGAPTEGVPPEMGAGMPPQMAGMPPQMPSAGMGGMA